MEPVSKASRRPSSKIRRQRSHEWKDYDSSSDNDEEKQTFRYEESNNQEVFHESPPEPAPASLLPGRPPGHHMDGLGRRPRLGYLESECESEPPYLPTMLTAYPSQDISLGNHATPLIEDSDNQELRNNSNINDNERIYSQPQQIQKCDDGKKPQHSGGPTYSNPLPVYCSTPSSTTGPMVPIANCVNPQLIQQPTRPPFTTPSKFTAINSSRFHFQKTCAHKCSWKLATIILIFLTTLLIAFVTYFAATNSMSSAESSKPCIVVEERESYPTASTPSKISISSGQSSNQRVCFLSPTEVSFYKKIELGKILKKHLSSHESWNLLFLHSDASFVRFNFSLPHSAKMALLARRNEPPSITAYDIMEVIADRLYKRTTSVQVEEINFLHYLEAGTWYLTLINDDNKPIFVVFTPNITHEIPLTCPNACHEHGNCHLGKCHCFPGYIGPDCADNCRISLMELTRICITWRGRPRESPKVSLTAKGL